MSEKNKNTSQPKPQPTPKPKPTTEQRGYGQKVPTTNEGTGPRTPQKKK